MIFVMNFEEYKERIIIDIQACMEALQVQPILFVGSGLSQRYFNAPDWDNLMISLANVCPLIDKRFAYYQQNHDNDNIKIASVFAELYSEWAWENGNNHFPETLFDSSISKLSYIKYEVANQINKLSEGFDADQNIYSDEIKSLRKVKPHAVITTNYDDALEKIFENYQKVIGQEIIRANYTAYGEILKIHGCASDINTIILTEEDYELFNKGKKYLSAKLLTYFAEHPLFFIGYSVNDSNIKSILADIDEILAPNGELIPNIYIISYDKDAETKNNLPLEQIIPLSNEKTVRLKVIHSKCFKWIFDVLGESSPEITVNPRLIRSLLARTFKLVNSDLPKQELPFNFQLLKEIDEQSDALPKLFGITEINNAQILNAQFDYTLTQIAKKLGYKTWHDAHVLIDKIKNETGVFIKDTDNKYHITIKTGSASVIHKYSNDAIQLLRKVKHGEEYHLDCA